MTTGEYASSVGSCPVCGGGARASRFEIKGQGWVCAVCEDGGDAIKAGNARVIRARLSDAKFFWDTDRKTKLEARLSKFEQITFHEKLGTQAARIERIAKLAKELAPVAKADATKAEKAASSSACATTLP